jgi:hypothetical protein
MSKLAKALTAAAGNAGGESLYVEDVFSTYVYEGAGSTQTITNGIDLDGEGGLVWIKNRDGATNHRLYTTDLYSASNSNLLQTNLTTAGGNTGSFELESFNSNGFTLGYSGGAYSESNGANTDYASWTFRKAEKFFDVQTFTTTGTGGTQILTHNLGVVPAFILLKRTSSTGNWWAIHSSVTQYSSNWWQNTGVLEGTGAFFQGDLLPSEPTDTEIALGPTFTNAGNEGTWVAYLFASDAGGFGDDGSENIIKCGSYTGTGSAGLEIDLGFEPQFLIVKKTNGVASWYMQDVMRGMQVSDYGGNLFANLSNAEAPNAWIYATATGFGFGDASVNYNGSGDTYIYIAIRRPMKTPESGTEVFSVDTGSASSTTPTFDSGFPVDWAFFAQVSGAANRAAGTRLLGSTNLLLNTTDAESGNSNLTFDSMSGWAKNYESSNYSWMFKRATGFFDVVAYTGDRSAGFQTITHNLKVSPELVIIKARNNTYNWFVNTSYLAAYNYALLNLSNAFAFDSTEPDVAIYDLTETTFKVGDYGQTNGNTVKFIAYLFATLAGVSKVGSYTGTGADLNVDCGFSAGARFILIKRTDATGDWYVWDSVRGIVVGNDPYLLLNTTDAEVTGTDYIDPLSSGFTVTSSAPAALNASGGSYIFLAIS